MKRRKRKTILRGSFLTPSIMSWINFEFTLDELFLVSFHLLAEQRIEEDKTVPAIHN